MITSNTFTPSKLNSIIKKITVITGNRSSKVINTMRFFADGLPGIMYQEADHEVFLNKDGRRACRLILYGQTVKPVEINTSGCFKILFSTFTRML